MSKSASRINGCDQLHLCFSVTACRTAAFFANVSGLWQIAVSNSGTLNCTNNVFSLSHCVTIGPLELDSTCYVRWTISPPAMSQRYCFMTLFDLVNIYISFASTCQKSCSDSVASRCRFYLILSCVEAKHRLDAAVWSAMRINKWKIFWKFAHKNKHMMKLWFNNQLKNKMRDLIVCMSVMLYSVHFKYNQ